MVTDGNPKQYLCLKSLYSYQILNIKCPVQFDLTVCLLCSIYIFKCKLLFFIKLMFYHQACGIEIYLLLFVLCCMTFGAIALYKVFFALPGSPFPLWHRISQFTAPPDKFTSQDWWSENARWCHFYMLDIYGKNCLCVACGRVFGIQRSFITHFRIQCKTHHSRALMAKTKWKNKKKDIHFASFSLLLCSYHFNTQHASSPRAKFWRRIVPLMVFLSLWGGT